MPKPEGKLAVMSSHPILWTEKQILQGRDELLKVTRDGWSILASELHSAAYSTMWCCPLDPWPLTSLTPEDLRGAQLQVIGLGD